VAAAPAASTGRVRVGGNIKAPTKVFNVAPVYPPALQEAGLEGVVKLDVLIGIDGIVESVRVVGAQVHPGFANAAIAAVKQWKFTRRCSTASR
jgi:TonB family protein